MVRIPFAVISGVFGLIGLLVIGSLWSRPFGEFGAPPLFFRLFGSLIAVVFIVVGGSGVMAALKMKLPTPRLPLGQFRSITRRSPAAPTYECPNCGATLTGPVEVSPSGDVKCPYCKSWFNIHARRP